MLTINGAAVIHWRSPSAGCSRSILNRLPTEMGEEPSFRGNGRVGNPLAIYSENLVPAACIIRQSGYLKRAVHDLDSKYRRLRGGAARLARQAHNLKVVGSNPAPATISEGRNSQRFRPSSLWEVSASTHHSHALHTSHAAHFSCTFGSVQQVGSTKKARIEIRAGITGIAGGRVTRF